MNEEIRKKIISILKATPAGNRSVDSLVMQLVSELHVQQEEVLRNIPLMEEAGDISYTGTSRTAIRLSLKAENELAPSTVRFKKYMSDNWIAVLGAITGVIGGLTSIAAIIISLIALHKP